MSSRKGKCCLLAAVVIGVSGLILSTLIYAIPAQAGTEEVSPGALGATTIPDPLTLAAAAAVEVSNVHAQQYGSFVRVIYDLSVLPAGPVAVNLAVSLDGGVTYSVDAASVYGAAGPAVQPGLGKVLVWNAYQDLPDQRVAEVSVWVETTPASGVSGLPESNLFAVDTRLEWLDGNADGAPDDIFDLDQDGTPDAAQDFDANGTPDAFEDADSNGIPDAYQDLSLNGTPDGFEDLNSDSVPDWFQDRLPLYSPSHPDSTKWYFSPEVVVDYTNYMDGTKVYGFRWVADQNESTIVDNSGTFRAAANIRSLQFAPTESGTWYFHIAAVSLYLQIIPGSQRNLAVQVHSDGFVVTSSTHPDSDNPSLHKTFEATVIPAADAESWAEVTGDPRWSPRSGHQAAVFQGKLWVMGGESSYSPYYWNDVWSSSDGATWAEEPTAAWSPRSGHQAVVFRDKLWVIGGYDGSDKNDVWSTVDGRTWVQETDTADWPSGSGLHVVVFLDKLWLLGASNGFFDEIWSSEDGVTWVQEDMPTGVCLASGYQVTVFRNKLWVLGECTHTYREVWSTVDGKEWTLEADAGWPPRRGHQLVSYQNKLWVIGGRHEVVAGDDYYFDDIWTSPNGEVWGQAISPDWEARANHQALVFRNKLWVLAGHHVFWDSEWVDSTLGDVWSMGSALPEDVPLEGYYYAVDHDPNTVPGTDDLLSPSPEISVTPGLAPGTYWFHVVAVDSAGQLSAPAHYRFIVADAPPGLSSPTHPDESIPGSGVSVTFEWNPGGVPDVVKYMYAWGTDENATPATQATGTTMTFDCVASGVYWFAVQSEDVWGFKSPIARRKVTVGITPGPEISSTTHPDPHTAYAARDITLAWIPSTGSGAPYYYVWDSDPDTVPTAESPTTTDTTLSQTNVSLGRYFLHLAASDDCGHVTSPTHFTVCVREALAPVVTLDPTSTSDVVRFTWTDPDDFAAGLPSGSPRFHLRFDRDPSSVVTTSSESPLFPLLYVWTAIWKHSGNYFFHIRARDTHGNLSAQSSHSVVISNAMAGLSAPSQTVTRTGPVYYTVTYPGATGVTLTADNVSLNKPASANGTVTVESTDDARVKRVVISNITGSGTFRISLAAGTASYPGGKTAPYVGPSVPFTVDDTPPQLTVSAPVPSVTATGPITYTLTYQGATDILLEPADVLLVSTPEGAAGATVDLSGNTNTRTVTLSDCWGEGRLHIVVAAGTASDANGGLANDVTGAQVTVDSVPPAGGVVINGGTALTNRRDATLACTYSDWNGTGVTQMHFSNDGTTWSEWAPAWATKYWELAPGDGAKTVYVQYRDAAGNVSQAASDAITLDATPPTGSVVINGGAAHTNSVNASLALTYDDGTGSGIRRMWFSNNGTSWSGLEDAGAAKSWALASGDGTKTVYAQFVDWAGNVSVSATDTVLLDTRPPTGRVSINGGAVWTNSRDVTLTLTSGDGSGSGVAQMRFGHDGTAWGEWETAGASKAWNLTDGDGNKEVYVQFRDAAGNVSGNVTDMIALDTTVPTGTVNINSGAEWGTVHTVTLNLSYADGTGSGVTQMRFSNDGTIWSDWANAASSAAWTMTEGDGLKAVQAQFRDSVGNISATASDSIALDGTAPVCTVTVNGGANLTNSRNVVLTLTVDDGTGSGPGQIRLSHDGTVWAPWEDYAASKPWVLTKADGAKTVCAQVRDRAGNTSETASDGIDLDTTVPTGALSINGGAAWANSRDVTLALTCSDASGSGVAQMRFSNDGTNWSTWETTAANKAWTMAAGDGMKTVFGQFKDQAGNMSGSVSDRISLDTVRPTGVITVNSGDEWTRLQAVTLTLTSNDKSGGSGVAQMRLSNDGTNWDAWAPVATSAAWNLTAGNGTKTVHAQFRDTAGNVSETVSDTIELDGTAPTVSIILNTGAAYTNAINASVALTVDDGAGLGPGDMQFSNDGTTWSTWEAYAATKVCALNAGDGSKIVYARVRDRAGNVSATVSDDIWLDTTVPTGTVLISGGAVWTNSRDVTLGLSGTDAGGSGLTHMRFSNNGADWSGWEAYTETKPWTLSAGDGAKTVYVQFRDGALNVSATASDGISLDTAGPLGTILINGNAPYTNSRDVALTVTANDGSGSGVADMRLSDNGVVWGAWTAFAATQAYSLPGGDGPKTVYVQFRDGIGNVSQPFSDAITLDTVSPTGSVVIAGGAPFTASANTPLALTAQDTGSGVATMRFSNTGADWSPWESFAAAKTWPLVPGDGLKTVYVQFMDNAGNPPQTVTDEVTLDTMAPAGTFTINGGAAHTNSPEVALAFEADDAGAGLTSLRVSNDGRSWTPWEDFATSRSWTLTTGDGTKTVYVSFRDAVGNFSVPASAAITLDTTPPDVALTTPSLRVTGPFTVTATFTDPVTGFEAGDVVVTNGVASEFSGTGNVYTWTVTPENEQAVTVAVPADACVDPVNLPNTASNTIEVTPIGMLTVTLDPAYARTAQGQWRVNGGDWHLSGESVELDPGEYTISFSPIPTQDQGGCSGEVSYQTPSDMQVTVVACSNTPVAAVYQQANKNVQAGVSMGGRTGDILLMVLAVLVLAGYARFRKPTSTGAGMPLDR